MQVQKIDYIKKRKFIFECGKQNTCKTKKWTPWKQKKIIFLKFKEFIFWYCRLTRSKNVPLKIVIIIKRIYFLWVQKMLVFFQGPFSFGLASLQGQKMESLKEKNKTKFSAFLGFASWNNFHFLDLPKWSKAMKRRKTHKMITTLTTTTIPTTKTKKNSINEEADELENYEHV